MNVFVSKCLLQKYLEKKLYKNVYLVRNENKQSLCRTQHILRDFFSPTRFIFMRQVSSHFSTSPEN